ncbi:putative transcription factor [Cardamine amara subsp. amara]|uniref:Transcription factor n=1 Tax=Cardamine amara subsp. amara TaxID=228776 RepID=A0ABD1B6H1_CARAN
MAKKQTRSSPNHSTLKKTSEVSSPAKKPLEVATTSKKPIEVASTSKKPVEEVASPSKKKKQPMINTPPESLTDDEEMETEEEGEEEEDASSEEEDKLKKHVKAPSASATVVAATVIQSSGSESGSDTESGETDSETEPPPPPPPAAVASSRALRTRPSELTAATDVNASKRAKTEIEKTENTAKKALFQRVWSKDDEVALLQGMLRLKNQTGKIPSDDFAASYEMVKGSSYLKEKSCSQFSTKVKNLEKKYLRRKKIRTTPHDLKCLDFCKKIWGNDIVVVKSKKKMKVEDDGSDWFEKVNLVGDLKILGLVDEDAAKKKWSLVSVETKKKLEEKLKDLEALDFERLMKRSQLVYEVSSAINKAN